MAGAYDYESRLADLSNRYNQENATQEYGRFLGQTRFSRQREDMNRNYMEQFPKFTGAWAGRLGSGIKSGVFNQGLQDNVQGFNRNLGRMDQDQAQFEGEFQMGATQRQAAYQKMLQALNDDFAAQRANQDPFSGYKGAY